MWHRVRRSDTLLCFDALLKTNASSLSPPPPPSLVVVVLLVHSPSLPKMSSMSNSAASHARAAPIQEKCVPSGTSWASLNVRPVPVLGSACECVRVGYEVQTASDQKVIDIPSQSQPTSARTRSVLQHMRRRRHRHALFCF